jgi:hypothetical protein
MSRLLNGIDIECAVFNNQEVRLRIDENGKKLHSFLCSLFHNDVSLPYDATKMSLNLVSNPFKLHKIYTKMYIRLKCLFYPSDDVLYVINRMSDDLILVVFALSGYLTTNDNVGYNSTLVRCLKLMKIPDLGCFFSLKDHLILHLILLGVEIIMNESQKNSKITRLKHVICWCLPIENFTNNLESNCLGSRLLRLGLKLVSEHFSNEIIGLFSCNAGFYDE